jgi:hypothetical protein
MGVIFAAAPARWLLSGVAALAAHAALLLGMPDAEAPRAEAPATLWMTVLASEQGSTNVEPSTGTSRAGSEPAPRRTTVARARTSARPHVAAMARNTAPPPLVEGAGELATVGSAAAHEGAGADDGVATGLGAEQRQGRAGAAGSGGRAATRPALLTTRSPCVGYFPAAAQVDHGRVQIQVSVDEAGHAHGGEIVVEAPRGHDFGSAARACASALRFAPARDALGAAVAGHAKLELHFHRS